MLIFHMENLPFMTTKLSIHDEAWYAVDDALCRRAIYLCNEVDS